MKRISSISLVLAVSCLPGCPTTPTDKGDVGGIDTSVAITDDPDGDGYGIDRDCDNEDASVYPDAPELCDEKDNDCDEVVDEGATTTFYEDGDGDSFGAGAGVDACEAPPGHVAVDGDCDDADPTVAPGLPEQCDDKDNDCDGAIDEDVTIATWYRDADSDGYGDPEDAIDVCGVPEGYVSNALDCDDTSYLDPVNVAAGGVPLPDTGETGVWTDTAFGSLPGGALNPLGSIQEGIDLANTCVFVQPGEYAENIDFRGKDILVLGVDGADTTVIRAFENAPVVTFARGETAAAELRGFTVTGGRGSEERSSETASCGYRDSCTTTTLVYRGGGIFIDGAVPTLADLIVTENELPAYAYTEVSDTEFQYVYSRGGGVYVENGAPAIVRSVLSLNAADEGGGVWLDGASDVGVLNTVIHSNEASSGGGVLSSGTFRATSSIFAFNVGTGDGGNFGGGAFTVAGGATTLVNASLYANRSPGGSVYVGASGTTVLTNVIASKNALGAILDGEAGATLTVRYSDVYGGSGANWGSFPDRTGTTGNVSVDPAFMSADTLWDTSDLHLSSGSPGIDAGDPAAIYNDTDGSRNDLGAYGGPDGSW